METDKLLKILREDPPRAHQHAPGGVWAAARDCLEYLEKTLQEGWVTLETGCGASTAVFAANGCKHTSVSLEEEEGEAVHGWCKKYGVDESQLDCIAGSSAEVLPKLAPTELDLVFIDGCHAFPFPAVDWYYTARRLRVGGIMVVDDLQLPAPDQVADFLRADPRWTKLVDGEKWGAWRREAVECVDEEWTSQPFFDTADHKARIKALRAAGELAPSHGPGKLNRRLYQLTHPKEALAALRRKLQPTQD
ncbi:MAG: class I SAM-dependent methyltransferase [Planctomycetota bacterium]